MRRASAPLLTIEMCDDYHESSVVPAKAGTQCLAANAAGSPPGPALECLSRGRGRRSREETGRFATPTIAAIALGFIFQHSAVHAQTAPNLQPFTVIGDAIPDSLTGVPGDAVRGRAIVANRQLGLCLLCHSGPIPEERFQGTLAPDLAGAGSRWSGAQLRLRLVDGRRLNPASIMPSYYRTQGLTRVGAAWQARTILTTQQIEDVVAYLRTLRTT
jgi:L-cysteine S-thiosulfotransferase